MTVEQLSKYGFGHQIVSMGITPLQLAKNANNLSELNSVAIEYSISRIRNDYGIGSIRGLKRRLEKMPKPDLVVLHQIYTLSTIIGYRYAKRNGIPYALQPHGSLTKYHESQNSFIKFIAKKICLSKILKYSCAVIVTCESERNDLDESLQSKVHILPYGANILDKKIENFLLEQEIQDDVRIVFSGRFDKKKNLNLLILSLKKILEKFPNMILDIAGSGTRKERSSLIRLVSDLELDSNVIFHGWVNTEKMRQLLGTSKLLVLPSENENFALVVAEALSLGTPCVVSKFVGTADVVAKHQAGVVIDQINPSSIAEGILKVLDGDPTSFKIAAFKATRAEFDWSKIAAQWKALVASVS